MRTRLRPASWPVTLAAAAVLVLAAGPVTAARFGASCEVQGAVAPQVSSIFSVYSAGGQGMVSAVTSAVQQNPELTDDVVVAGCGGGVGSAALNAAADGLAGAAAGGAGVRVSSGMRCACQQMLTAFAVARTSRTLSVPFGAGLSGAGGGAGVISPSRP